MKQSSFVRTAVSRRTKLETNNRKYTSLSFLSLSALFGYLCYLILTQFADLFRVGGSDFMGTGLAWTVVGGSAASLLGLIAFTVLMSNSTYKEFGDDVFSEIQKVTWPTGNQTAKSTIVVSVTVLIAAVMFLVMDLIWGNIFDLIL